MKSVLKPMLVLSCLALVSIPLWSAPASVSCANVSVETSPDTVTAGYGVGIYGSIGNCTEGRKRFTVVVSAISDCGQETGITSFRMAFKPDENRMFGVSYTTAPETCDGLATVTVDVLDDRGVLARASTTFAIVN